MSAELPENQRALIASAQAAEAVAGLLCFVQEGPHSAAPFGEVEVVAKLAEALGLAARIEHDGMADLPFAAEHRSELGQLIAACRKFIDGWVG